MMKRGRLKAGGRSPEKAITGRTPPWRSVWSLATVAVIAAVALLAFASPDNDDGDDGGPDDPGDPGPGQVYHDVGIPVSDLSTQARWYTYESGDAKVRFFTVLEEDGKHHVALDACDVCYSRHLGFHQEGLTMTCNSCGKAYPVDGLGSENLPDNCWPGYVPYQVSDGYLLIDTQFLDVKAYMFE